MVLAPLLGRMLELATSPAGQALLMRLFKDAGITDAKLDELADKLRKLNIPDPKE